jgi:hypothetical protein
MMAMPSLAGSSFPAPDPAATSALLLRWLAAALQAEGFSWLSQEIERQRAGDERRLAVALGLAGRKTGRRELPLTVDDIASAQALRDGWQPQYWGTDDAARAALLLAAYRGDDSAFAARLERLCVTAELTEHVSYMKGLAVFPAGKALLPRGREGVRSSIAPLFEAIACRNPYPRDMFDNDAWNQMVVKCVFGGTPLAAVIGLSERRNDDLIAMLRGLVSERHAAGRPLPAEVHAFIAE